MSVKALGLPIYPRRHQFPLTQRNDACPTFCEKQRDQSSVPAAIRGMHALSIMSVAFFVVLVVLVVVQKEKICQSKRLKKKVIKGRKSIFKMRVVDLDGGAENLKCVHICCCVAKIKDKRTLFF